MKCVFSPDAQSDIDAIWEKTFEEGGDVQAQAYVQLFQTASLTIANNPRGGRDCSEIRSGYRKYLVGSQAVFYRIGEDFVDIVRIMHQPMDFGRHF